MSTDDPSPQTAAVPVTWRTRLSPRARFARVGESTTAIAQIVVAVTAAYAFANGVLGHAIPLLAVTVTISSLGLARDTRPRAVAETVVGMLVGILVAEALYLVAGSGWWQLAIALAVTLAVARFLSPQPAFAIAAAVQAAIVMVFVVPVPFVRVVDGAVGGAAALLVTALIPRNPMRAETRDGRAVIAGLTDAGAAVVQALRRGDPLRGVRGLEKARGLEPLVQAWRSSLESGIAVSRVSPFLRRRRSELERHQRMQRSLDLAIRNLRVVARRAAYLVEDGRARPVLADVLADVLRAGGLLADALDDISMQPAAHAAVAAVAQRLDPRALAEPAAMGDANLAAALRPLVVDLLTAAGEDVRSAQQRMPRL